VIEGTLELVVTLTMEWIQKRYDGSGWLNPHEVSLLWLGVSLSTWCGMSHSFSLFHKFTLFARACRLGCETVECERVVISICCQCDLSSTSVILLILSEDLVRTTSMWKIMARLMWPNAERCHRFSCCLIVCCVNGKGWTNGKCAYILMTADIFGTFSVV